MSKEIKTMSNFNGGEVSPKTQAFTFLEKYQFSLRSSMNAICTKYGPITRRPGTIFVALAKTDSGSSY